VHRVVRHAVGVKGAERAARTRIAVVASVLRALGVVRALAGRRQGAGVEGFEEALQLLDVAVVELIGSS
jgi:hypothetical protein